MRKEKSQAQEDFASSAFLEQVRGEEGIVLTAPSGQEVLLLDRYCRSALRRSLSTGTPGRQERMGGPHTPAEQGFLNHLKSTDEFQPGFSVQLGIISGRMPPAHWAPAIEQLALALEDAQFFQLRLYLMSDAVPWWKWMLGTLHHGLEPIRRALQNGECGLTVEGTITPGYPDEVMDHVVSGSVALRYVCEDLEVDLSDARCEQLLQIAHTGLRIPTIVYVGDGVPGNLKTLLQRAIQASQYSGFGIRPIQAHPMYAPGKHGPPITPDEFLPLLVDLYKEFPYYDDVFEPVNTVISRLDPKNDAKKQLNMIIDGEGQVCVYRKLPSLRTRIGSLSDVRAMDPKKLRRLLWDRGNSIACADARCAPCRWRYVCGGMDPTEETADPSLFETVCDTWQFLLEMLAWERSNVVKTAAERASQ